MNEEHLWRARGETGDRTVFELERQKKGVNKGEPNDRLRNVAVGKTVTCGCGRQGTNNQFRTRQHSPKRKVLSSMTSAHEGTGGGSQERKEKRGQ